MIDSYSFGKISINGNFYSSDIIIYDDFIEDNWWRKRGHDLGVYDIGKYIEKFSPEILIVGTGAYGGLVVQSETIKFLKDKKIILIAEETGDAFKSYNSKFAQNKVMGAFHLTC